MSEEKIILKFVRETRKLVNSRIEKNQEVKQLYVSINCNFDNIKKKYLELYRDNDQDVEVNFYQGWKTLEGDQTPKQKGFQNGAEIKVDYNPFMRDEKIQLHTMSSVILAGVYDQDSPLHLLAGCPHILSHIWRLTVDQWKQVIQFPSKINSHDFNWYECQRNEDYAIKESHPEAFFVAPIFPGLKFPKPSEIDINMMPFILEETFEKCQLPEVTRPYWELIEACAKPEFMKRSHQLWSRQWKSEVGKVCYLTIQESKVTQGTSQRRPGLHVDNPGYVKIKNENLKSYGEGLGHSNPYIGHEWGSGGAHLISGDGLEDRFNHIVMTGGIYLASSLPNSCKVWDCKIVPEQDGKEVIGKLGDIEHFRHLLPEGHVLEPHQIYWITDRTPHESLPLPEGGSRQFFRLVTSQVSIWYQDHSTPNPLGVEPDPNITKVVKGDKFSDEGVDIVLN